MINVFYEDINVDSPKSIYTNIFNLMSSEAEYNDMITNVHSVAVTGYKGSVYNVTFDYDKDIEVMIHILFNGKIHIEAPEDMITGTESLILGEFPELIDSFI